jgi:integrase/recombinase XerC
LVLDVERCGVFVRRGKCGRPRYVRIRRQFVRACTDFLAWKEAVGEPVDDDAPLLLSSGGHFTTRGLQKAFDRCCARVGITEHSIHHARHTYASHLYVASGKDLRLVQRQLGHTNIRTTEVYAHVFDHNVDRAVEKLYA